VRVKICGITNLEDALLCQKYGADALGFIFYQKSPRYISPEKAAEITAHLSPFITKTGVFVNESAENINRTAETAGLSLVQLHGDESPDFARNIKLPVMKAFRIKEGFDFKLLEQYPGCSFLLDSFDTDAYGGSGQSFDWQLIPEKLRHRIVLAGGVSLENIEKICTDIKPAAVDVSSSLEDAPGIKNHEKVIEFLNRIKGYENC
jgi:phosphoribosylanthranilate isomerase